MDPNGDDNGRGPMYPVAIDLDPVTEGRDRVTTAFRFFLALPHMILVGGPVAVATSFGWDRGENPNWEFGSHGGVMGAVASFVSIIAWFAILFTGRYPQGLWNLVEYYLRWRVRAVAYMTLLRDEYPPFGEGDYPAELDIEMPDAPRNRVTVFFRLLLVLPHVFVLGLLGALWGFTTAISWIWILLTGRYPTVLYGYALGVFSWMIRVEAYMLLMRDEYPPFTLRV
jgi:hypothetical protein